MYKKIVHWWQSRREKFYHRNRWHLVLDIFLVVVIILLSGITLRLALYHPAVISALNLKPPVSNIVQEAPQPDFQVSAISLKSAVAPGAAVPLAIDYENTGAVAIDQADLSLGFASAAFQLIGLKINDPSATVVKNKITIKNIAPGASGHLEVKATWKTVQENFPRSLSWRLSVRANTGQTRLEKEISLADVKIISDFQAKASLYYYSPQGDQLGIGPVPPVVGIPTTYWLVLKAINSGNDLKNLVFSAQLAPGVELSGGQSLLAGKFSYNRESRRLIWQVDSLNNTGGDYIANFGLTLTPTSDQVGKNALILKDLQYHTDDVWTGTEISGQLENLDSSLPDDRLNHGNGLITK